MCLVDELHIFILTVSLSFVMIGILNLWQDRD